MPHATIPAQTVATNRPKQPRTRLVREDAAATKPPRRRKPKAAATTVPPTSEPRRPGRPPKAREPEPFVEPIAAGSVKHLKLDRIDLEDMTFMFRASMRVGDLKESIRTEGQQLPIIVRKRKDGKYQVISGFRRTRAIKELGWDTIATIERELRDEEAFKASVLENTARKTYSDLDRAYVIREYEERGHKGTDVATLMGLSKRQKNNLKGLLDLPKEVQHALEKDGKFKATHALLVKKLKKKYPHLDYGRWIRLCDEEDLSVAQLTRRVNEAYRGADAKGFMGLFNAKGTNAEGGMFRFKPLRVDLGKMSEEERGKLKEEVRALWERL